MIQLNQRVGLIIFVLIICTLLLGGCSSSSSSEENNDDDPDISFNSGNIAPGETFSYTFSEEGSFEYYCEIHAPNMQGEITISSSTSSAERDTVLMQNDSFLPGNITVEPGTEIIWLNDQGHDHTVMSGNPASGGGPDY